MPSLPTCALRRDRRRRNHAGDGNGLGNSAPRSLPLELSQSLLEDGLAAIGQTLRRVRKMRDGWRA